MKIAAYIHREYHLDMSFVPARRLIQESGDISTPAKAFKSWCLYNSKYGKWYVNDDRPLRSCEFFAAYKAGYLEFHKLDEPIGVRRGIYVITPLGYNAIYNAYGGAKGWAF